MAESSDAIRSNIIGVSDLVTNKTNKVAGGVYDSEEGISGEPEDLLSLKDSDEELLLLARRREAIYAPYESKIKMRQQKNLKYYLGKGLTNMGYVDDDPIAANFMFEAEETFLPAALSKNPEPVVYCNNTPEGNKLSDDVKTMLQYHADALALRPKLKKMTRQHSIYLLGVLKYGWDETIKDITTEVRKVQDFIFDPNGYVDEQGDFTSWLGERITISADKLAELYPKHKEYIALTVNDKMGTEIIFTEWRDDELCFATYKEVVLDKHKNEFFNYDQEGTDEFGLPTTTKGQNHFAKPKKPYTFLSVFSLGEQPHDITGLIEQNIPNQNLVTRRTTQLDYNLSRANNSTAFSENNFNQETAKQAANAWLKGNPILVPPGSPISEAVHDFPPPSVPDAFFKEQENNIQNLRSIFGTLGISNQEQDEDQTARGMILNQQYSNTRIGGGIGEAIEGVAKAVFNWWVQLYNVFYDEQHFAAVLGQMKATEYVELSSQNLGMQLIVSVVPDSMKPKDELTVMNQAMQLWEQQALDIKTLLTILNFPDPQETAAQVWLYHTNPQLYGQLNFPDLQAMIEQQAQKQMAMEQAGQQQQLQAQGAQADQQLQQKGAAGAQALQQKDQAHAQKMTQTQQLHEQKMSLAKEPASASLSSVKLPK